MAISLTKGQNISLSRTDPNLKNILIGLGWDARESDGQDFDLDASVFMTGADRKVPSDSYFIFYNQLKSPCGGVEHTGDNLTGDGDGDDESVIVHLDRIEERITSLFVTVTIHDYEIRKQNFGQVSNAFIRLVNNDTGEEIVRFDLSEDYSTETAMVFGEVYRRNGEWKFRAIGQGYQNGLYALCKNYGVDVE
ncbi:chemical-damaging agent resistance protein C [Psittacicella melopsittaci]|uniref:Chemical-damaging agent resistance protein C n=1 Tax=Psittacicella melopsittaci TaxID=2028576 RepID=A0A3A1Y7U7_9GAMM|nr:TerD family protein [Psittacicella melopsittaci]RIY33320.1 chemical-damaging agent resistance protein C [Psittacicella melopsittaci]